MISRDALGELASALRKAEVSENSIGTAVTILENIGEFDPNGNLPKDPADWLDRQIGGSLEAGINFIPSDLKGACHDLLVTVCAGERNFDLNTMETIALCINCHNTIKAVVLASDYWVEKEFNKWRKPAFKALHDQFGIAFFIFTPLAGRWTVSPIVL